MAPEASAAAHTRGAPFWPSAVAVILIALTYASLPAGLREGPRWLLPVMVLVVAVAARTSRWRGYHTVTPWLGRLATALMTVALATSVILLITTLPGSRASGRELLGYAALLWAINVVVFALWYWEVDSGGPHRRRPGSYGTDDFAFPQYQLYEPQQDSSWVPGFVDYLFLAFNTSTAFSPSDTMIMSRRAKSLMMAQSILSLLILGVLVARAISLL